MHVRDRVILRGFALIFSVWLCCAERVIAAPAAIPSTAQPGAVERSLQRQLPNIDQDRIDIPAPEGFAAPQGAEKIRFVLRRVALSGNTALATEVLAPAYDKLVGHDVSLADVFAAARAITDAYAKAGYALSFAVVPAQQIDKAGGEVRIDVVEGYIAEVRFDGPAPSTPEIERYGRRITASRPLRSADLERYLLLMNDAPGVSANAVFDRTENGPSGATRLVVKVEVQTASLHVDANNRGSRAFGPWRADADLTLVSLVDQGEALELRGVRALNQDELSFGSAALTLPIGGDGASASLTGTWSNARPGTALLASSDFISNGYTTTATLTWPWLRSRRLSVWVWGGVSAKWLRSDLGGAPNSRDQIYLAQLGANGSRRDATGATAGDFSLIQGLDIFNVTTSASPERSRAAGDGVYSAVKGDLTRLQNLYGDFDLYLSASGQYTSRGLLSSEQCGYGGAVFGRGFDDNEIVGDVCLMGSAELRYTPAVPAWTPHGLLSQVQLFAVYDGGEVWNDGALSPGEYRTARASSVGGGVRLQMLHRIDATVEFDQPIGRNVALEGDRNGRIFITLGVRY